MPTLTALIEQKQHLETQLEDVLTYTEELEDIWNNTNIEIAKKIDAYGFVIDDIKNKIEFLADKKRKVTDIKQKLENEIERIKFRLNQHCDGNKLIGNEYKMHPFMSTTNTIDVEQVEEGYGAYIIAPLTFSEKETLRILLEDYIADCMHAGDERATVHAVTLEEKLNKPIRKIILSDLPTGHKAIITKLVPSVRIT
jgi:chaperonin cofactor prefoldin